MRGSGRCEIGPPSPRAVLAPSQGRRSTPSLVPSGWPPGRRARGRQCSPVAAVVDAGAIGSRAHFLGVVRLQPGAAELRRARCGPTTADRSRAPPLRTDRVTSQAIHGRTHDATPSVKFSTVSTVSSRPVLSRDLRQGAPRRERQGSQANRSCRRAHFSTVRDLLPMRR